MKPVAVPLGSEPSKFVVEVAEQLAGIVEMLLPTASLPPTPIATKKGG
jgi:hypothetical protein